ncbi:PSD1 and planctomycete cytochrome C domain-containing protein [Cyclobacterium sp. 1_MG-2023]|uniref:PSD1 and planctomycete cytochrome C domain-containing protein n=1 Tax=Cyclobacterium sp. 1_MG-2023 TaxID=3062681 RepID=UPI0026E2DD6A|nr:PSD1 and planctomycete cytochrome C domain-containing protein [Cyclobacterium sp. 1_MG-2023]MDO6438969.1 PSD1 and planctomycete cytochrome C domain-containing protein [Cyclobacterium sp. 1_MG-2023]
MQKCYLCHGPDPSSREAGLRLDLKEGATMLLESGKTAIVPSAVHKSALIERITSDNPEVVMPPPSLKQKLSDYEVALIKKWIKEGAEYEPHWAFMPAETNKKVVKADFFEQIDALIQEKISEKGLESSEKADKYQLIRRLSFVLTGLPPDVERVKQFVADECPEAYMDLVDEYLNHPAFGEKWASHWMDVVRYAETKGHEFDYQIQGAWRFRDYLIRAFNQGVPYDQLLKEQLMGDMLSSPRENPVSGENESALGTMFFTMSEGTHSPVDIKKDEADRIDNMIDVVGKSFQGLTVACAKCHDHKFDPIPTADYYGLYGMLGSTRFSPLPVGNGKIKFNTVSKAAELKRKIKSLVANEWTGPLEEDSIPVRLVNISSVPESAKDINIIADFRGLDFQGWKADGLAFGANTTLGEPIFSSSTSTLKALSPGFASSQQFGRGIWGALRSPDFTVDKNFIGISARGKGASIRIVMENFQLISYPIYGGLDQKVDDEAWQNYTFDLSAWKGRKVYIEILPGSFVRHQYTQKADAYIEAEYVISFDEAWQTPDLKDTEANLSISKVVNHWVTGKSSAKEIAFLNRELTKGKLKKDFPSALALKMKCDSLGRLVKDSVFIQGVTEGFGGESNIFIRGNHSDPSNEKVPRIFLSGIFEEQKPYQGDGSGRQQMVEMMLAADNPLTSRVMVNRIWHHVFGKGLVETVDNFGLQGKLPTHPELLDYLALAFVKNSWSIKTMIKNMVLTQAFQRSTSGGSMSLDPDNLYLSRYSVRRLEAESIRDAVLKAAGTLDSTMFGKPVPVHLTEFMQGRGRPGDSGPLDGNGRRSVYLEVRRNFLDRMMTAFDRPTPFTTFGKRDVTNVPAQSLFLMNDPFITEQANHMANQLLNNKNLMEDEDRINDAYLRAFARLPSPDEISKGLGFVNKTKIQLAENAESDKALNILAWKEYCHALFNMKSFIYLM